MSHRYEVVMAQIDVVFRAVTVLTAWSTTCEIAWKENGGGRTPTNDSTE